MRGDRKRITIAIIASACMLSFAWPHIGGLTFLIFFGFVPLLYVEDLYAKKQKSSKAIFFPMFLAFFAWNIATTWFIFMIKLTGSTPWEEFVSRVTASGLTYILNSIFMAIVFWLFHYSKKHLGSRLGYLGLIIFWLSFEYIHMHWSINWPWLNLGNVFANDTWAIQWYEFTGAPGGSLWVLLVNISFYQLWKKWKEVGGVFSKVKYLTIRTALLLIVPAVVSLYIYQGVEDGPEKMKAIALQPNVDPYTQKFEVAPIIQLQEMLELADSVLNDEVALVLFPETAIQERSHASKTDGRYTFVGAWEGHYENMESVKEIRKITAKYPRLTVIVGLSDKKAFLGKEKTTETARYSKPLDLFYDSYNSLISVKENEEIVFYRKSKLVPGVESVPFGKLMKKIEGFALDLGGTTGSLGTQKGTTNFIVDGHEVGAMVCYESIFGEFVTEFVRDGAEVLSISTNDSWWQESPGYQQLLAYARLRAIENRRSIIRSANTGITCYINSRGDITSRSDWWVKTALPGSVALNTELTFYTKYGDFISRIASFLSIIILLYTMVRRKQK
ncbi:MAG: apolipoprotein N-acyltransferase [Patiriisocius sp.]|jgi:apolipoprotein N-acyltransferase